MLPTFLLCSCINFSDMINIAERDLTVYGTVVDARDGSPLENATVSDAHWHTEVVVLKDFISNPSDADHT